MVVQFSFYGGSERKWFYKTCYLEYSETELICRYFYVSYNLHSDWCYMFYPIGNEQQPFQNTY
jgi:hypothetical protein